ncbi:MAG: efflux RND transporter periplasmic adaptor subunit [Blastocatellia bacterium]
MTITCKQFFYLLALTLACVVAVACGSGAPKPQTQPAAAASPPLTVNVTTVEAHELNRQLRLPGELLPFEDVAIFAKVQGFVEQITVDRGSMVKRGQLLARLRAPELDTQRREAEARVSAVGSQRVEAQARVASIRAQRIEAEARLASDESTFKRLKAASATPGVVAGNDVEIAERTVESGRARVQALIETERAAQAQIKTFDENERGLKEAVRSASNIEAYLQITAPFDGVITERNVHPGSLAGSLASPSGMAMLRLQQVSRLRLVISVPETEISGITPGAKLNFTLPAFPGETFTGTVTRNSRSLDAKTRTMPIELDVANSGGKLAPGMFPEVQWPTRRPHPSLFVPPAAIATTTERSFVIRIRDGVAEWVDVKRGASMNQKGVDLVEVFGELAAGDTIAARGTDELRAGTKVNIKQPTQPAQGGK